DEKRPPDRLCEFHQEFQAACHGNRQRQVLTLCLRKAAPAKTGAAFIFLNSQKRIIGAWNFLRRTDLREK
ncbi:MAG: hypothetical protein PHP45_11285, partial [Elusimicrobiales bacterium]|nr:hypothetical protein [Elusimicrobiales bacterium]